MTTQKKPTKLDALVPYHDKIVFWYRQQHLDLRAIASHLNALKCPEVVNHNVVARYLQKHGLRKSLANASDAVEAIEPCAEALTQPVDTAVEHDPHSFAAGDSDWIYQAPPEGIVLGQIPTAIATPVFVNRKS